MTLKAPDLRTLLIITSSLIILIITAIITYFNILQYRTESINHIHHYAYTLPAILPLLRLNISSLKAMHPCRTAFFLFNKNRILNQFPSLRPMAILLQTRTLNAWEDPLT